MFIVARVLPKHLFPHLLLVMAFLFGLYIGTYPSAALTTTKYVATTGNDANPGTLEQPWRTVRKGLTAIRAGETLYIRGGTYTERIKSPTLAAGTATNRITIKAYPGERPILKGLLWLKGMQYWTIDGLNVTWDAATGLKSEHMVKFTDGLGWHYTNAEVWDAKSFAGIYVTGAARQWRLSHLFVHDTHQANNTNQDHLLYINPDVPASASDWGVIERNLLINSPNGRAVKVGGASSSSPQSGGVIIRYNTMYNNLGPSSVHYSWSASSTRVYRNIMQKPASGRYTVSEYDLTGTDHLVYENIGWAAKGVVQPHASITNGGGNIYLDPKFSDITAQDFRPLNPDAQAYGLYAP